MSYDFLELNGLFRVNPVRFPQEYGSIRQYFTSLSGVNFVMGKSCLTLNPKPQTLAIRDTEGTRQRLVRANGLLRWLKGCFGLTRSG